MRIHWFQHAAFEGLGKIADWAGAHGHSLSCTRFQAGEQPPDLAEVDWLVVMGGPMSVWEEDAHPWLKAEKRYIQRAIGGGRRVIGICLGAQLVAEVLGARVRPNPEPEIGWFPVTWTPEARASLAFGGAPPVSDVFHWHGDTFELPPGSLRLASSAACPNQGFSGEGERVVGLQFHLEMSPQGVREILKHGAKDLRPGPWVQSEAAIIGQPGQYLEAQGLLADVLGRLAG